MGSSLTSGYSHKEISLQIQAQDCTTMSRFPQCFLPLFTYLATSQENSVFQLFRVMTHREGENTCRASTGKQMRKHDLLRCCVHLKSRTNHYPHTLILLVEFWQKKSKLGNLCQISLPLQSRVNRDFRKQCASIFSLRRRN